jgi:VWFA-related protein
MQLAILACAQESTFQVTTNVVVVDAQVVSKKTGRTIGALKKSDFEILENGEKQDIAYFSQNELPLSIVFLFDLTDTVRPVLKPLAAGALEALHHLKPEDETAVMVYDSTARLLQDFTTDRALTVAAIEKARDMTSDEEAYFNEGIYQAAAESDKAKNPGSRRVIIWLTDNVPNIPPAKIHTEADAYQKLFETGTVVSCLLERSAMSDTFLVLYTKNPLFGLSRKHAPPGDVYKYAAQTGGQVMKSSKADVATKLAELIDQIRTRYSLGYHPSRRQAAGTFCEIKVNLAPGIEKREGAALVKTKRGYYRKTE